MKFTKQPLSVPAQVAKLQSRGLVIPDSAAAEHYLRYIGYYRLSAYALPLQQHGQPGKPFKPGVSFLRFPFFHDRRKFDLVPLLLPLLQILHVFGEWLWDSLIQEHEGWHDDSITD